MLRCFLPNLTERTRVIHELHTTINRSFAAHGIEIPFLQPEAAAKPTFPLMPRRAAGKGEGTAVGPPSGHHEPEAA